MHQRRQGSVWRASKPWCKALQPQDVPAALARFAECGGALSAADIYGGPRGAATQLQRLEHWFKVCSVASTAPVWAWGPAQGVLLVP